MVSTGTSPASTSGAGPAAVVLAGARGRYRHLVISNEGAAAGFFSLDGGATWCRLPAGRSVALDDVDVPADGLTVRRDGSADLTGVYAFAY